MDNCELIQIEKQMSSSLASYKKKSELIQMEKQMSSLLVSSMVKMASLELVSSIKFNPLRSDLHPHYRV